MKLPRRTFLRLAAGAAALPAVSRFAWAQAYPSRPVRIVVGFAPGGPQDTLARLIGQWLSERLGQPFIIENRPGAGSNIAAEAVVRAAADGHTLLSVGPANAINATLYNKLNFDFVRDIAPVASISRESNVMQVRPTFPINTVPEFIGYAKANPGKISMGSAGNGSSSHVAGELFKMMTGIDMVHVPYRGVGPAMTDLLGGQVHVMFGNMPASMEHIRAGRLRPLAVTTATRSEVLPDGEFVSGYEASGLYGMGAPKKTPAEIVDKLNKEINAALADPKMRARLSDMGSLAFPGSPADCSATDAPCPARSPAAARTRRQASAGTDRGRRPRAAGWRPSLRAVHHPSAKEGTWHAGGHWWRPSEISRRSGGGERGDALGRRRPGEPLQRGGQHGKRSVAVRVYLVRGVVEHVFGQRPAAGERRGYRVEQRLAGLDVFIGGNGIEPRIGPFVGRLHRGNGAVVPFDHGKDRIRRGQRQGKEPRSCIFFGGGGGSGGQRRRRQAGHHGTSSVRPQDAHPNRSFGSVSRALHSAAMRVDAPPLQAQIRRIEKTFAACQVHSR